MVAVAAVGGHTGWAGAMLGAMVSAAMNLNWTGKPPLRGPAPASGRRRFTGLISRRRWSLQGEHALAPICRPGPVAHCWAGGEVGQPFNNRITVRPR